MKRYMFLIVAILVMAGCTDSGVVNYFETGKSELNEGHYEEAIDALKMELKENPDNTDAKKLLKEAEEKNRDKTAEDKKAKEREEERKRIEEEKNKKEQEEAKKREKFATIYYTKELTNYLTNGNLVMSDITLNYLIAHHDIFPALSAAKIEEAKQKTDKTITSAHISKNINPYLDKMVTFSGSVVNVSESTEAGNTVSYLHVMGDDWQSHEVLLLKTTGDILKGDTVRFWGVPVGENGFDNVSGGYTRTIFYIASHVQKN